LNKEIPKHAKVFAPVGEQISLAVKNFIAEVKDGKFPVKPGPSS
jgi:ketopantoate hydroxymethyltransferase